MDIEMINPWTQAGSYHGHFERSQTLSNYKNWKPRQKVLDIATKYMKPD